MIVYVFKYAVYHNDIAISYDAVACISMNTWSIFPCAILRYKACRGLVVGTASTVYDVCENVEHITWL